MVYVILTNIIAVVVVLGVMILVHEAGHFVAAKYFGIRVHVFSFGFGWRLFGVKVGDTDYRVSALPLGGYVKMAGENPNDPTSGSPDEFQSKPRWQRFTVAVMGPAMNVVLAIALLTGLYMYRYQKPAYQEGPAVIGWVESGTPALAAGFQAGDRIARLGNTENPTWQDVEIEVLSSAGQQLEVAVERQGQLVVQNLTPQPEGRARLGMAGWYPSMPAKVEAVDPGMPAALGGLQPGDEIVSINGVSTYFWPKK